MTETRQLLADYVKTGSETAFREIVDSYINLVYSAAVRLAESDTHLAQDIAQTVFADLARMAPKLSPDVMLGGWLHRHTCFVASNIMRRERRRRLREKQSIEMNPSDDHSDANLAAIAPVLDEAINELATDDRQAILLRFFEQRDFRSVGEALGSNEEAARKRVHRAVDKLHALLTRRGIALSATALASSLAAGSVTAAPPALAASVCTAALAGAVTTTAAASTILNIMSMTKLKLGAAAFIVAAGLAVPIVMQHQKNTLLREEIQTLRQQAQAAGELGAENKRLATLLAEANSTPAPALTDEQFRELLRLRGEVGRLRQQIANAPVAAPKSGSLLSEVTSNPEMLKLIRNQNKQGLGIVYKDLAKIAKLTPEQSDQLIDLLVDDVLENVELVTTVLREDQGDDEREWLFARQEAILLEKVQALLGPGGLAHYQDYTRDLLAHLTAQQFKAKLSGDDAAKDEKLRRLYDVVFEEKQAALAAAGLPPDYQTVPTLNFRNFASESAAEKNLQLLDQIYERVGARSESFFSPEELKSFGEYRNAGISTSRMALTINRKFMSPSSN